MFKKKPKVNKPRQRIDALFDAIGATVPSPYLDNGWLYGLRDMARRSQAGWRGELAGYLRGSMRAQRITEAQFDNLMQLLGDCYGEELSIWRGAPAVLTVAASVVATLGCHVIAASDGAVILAMVLPITCGIWWASREPAFDAAFFPPGRRAERWIMTLFAGFVSLVVVWGVAAVMSTMLESRSQRDFASDQKAFMANTKGYALLRKFASTYYDVDVVLGNMEESWSRTTIGQPQASPASMELGPGYCFMSFNPENTLISIPPPAGADKALWIQGVMMHEFGHCLDNKRDMPAFGQHTVQVHALAPRAAQGVTDIPGYVEAERKDSTQLWREAVADTFAVGYWRITADRPTARLLTQGLADFRQNHAGSDPTHSTVCWIKAAWQRSPPKSYSDLFAWADESRSAAQCSIPEPRPPLWDRVKEAVRDRIARW